MDGFNVEASYDRPRHVCYIYGAFRTELIAAATSAVA